MWSYQCTAGCCQTLLGTPVTSSHGAGWKSERSRQSHPDSTHQTGSLALPASWCVVSHCLTVDRVSLPSSPCRFPEVCVTLILPPPRHRPCGREKWLFHFYYYYSCYHTEVWSSVARRPASWFPSSWQKVKAGIGSEFELCFQGVKKCLCHVGASKEVPFVKISNAPANLPWDAQGDGRNNYCRDKDERRWKCCSLVVSYVKTRVFPFWILVNRHVFTEAWWTNSNTVD